MRVCINGATLSSFTSFIIRLLIYRLANKTIKMSNYWKVWKFKIFFILGATGGILCFYIELNPTKNKFPSARPEGHLGY